MTFLATHCHSKFRLSSLYLFLRHDTLLRHTRPFLSKPHSYPEKHPPSSPNPNQPSSTNLALPRQTYSFLDKPRPSTLNLALRREMSSFRDKPRPRHPYQAYAHHSTELRFCSTLLTFPVTLHPCRPQLASLLFSIHRFGLLSLNPSLPRASFLLPAILSLPTPILPASPRLAMPRPTRAVP